uniref:General transcription factor IIH subunit 5 n=1 Tax=Timema monikensis TaxID=170555 RepID=A0A7R9EB68_9NEOP|nr:unnamed protein product [Timema monikensis]
MLCDGSCKYSLEEAGESRENPDFNAFLNKYTNMKIPDESTLRKHYLHSTYLSVSSLKFDEEQAVTITEANAAICSSVSVDLARKKQFWKSSWSNHSFRGEGFASCESCEDNAGNRRKPESGFKNLNQASGSVGTAIVDKFNRVLHDQAMKQFLLHLDETIALGRKFIIQDLDETHLFISADIVETLQARVDDLMDQISFPLSDKGL